MFTIKFKDKTHRVVFQHALDGTSCFIQREQLDKTLVNVSYRFIASQPQRHSL